MPVIGRITPGGSVSEFVIPAQKGPKKVSLSVSFSIGNIAADPDGDLWFTTSSSDDNTYQTYGSEIGRITPSGKIKTFPLGRHGGRADWRDCRRPARTSYWLRSQRVHRRPRWQRLVWRGQPVLREDRPNLAIWKAHDIRHHQGPGSGSYAVTSSDHGPRSATSGPRSATTTSTQGPTTSSRSAELRHGA